MATNAVDIFNRNLRERKQQQVRARLLNNKSSEPKQDMKFGIVYDRQRTKITQTNQSIDRFQYEEYDALTDPHLRKYYEKRGFFRR